MLSMRESMNVLQLMVKIRPTLFRALENHANTAAQATAPTHTPPASAIPCKSIFLNKEFPVTISIVTVAANTISRTQSTQFSIPEYDPTWQWWVWRKCKKKIIKIKIKTKNKKAHKLFLTYIIDFKYFI